MDLIQLKEFFLTCGLLSLGLVLWWAGAMAFGREIIYNLHSRFFEVDEKHFNSIHYMGIAILKIFAILIFWIPYIALQIG